MSTFHVLPLKNYILVLLIHFTEASEKMHDSIFIKLSVFVTVTHTVYEKKKTANSGTKTSSLNILFIKKKEEKMNFHDDFL